MDIIYEKKLGKVTSASIFFEDHGTFTFSIGINYGTGNQLFCGYALDRYDEKKNRRVGKASGLDLIMQLITLFDVNTFHDIIGKAVYALFDRKTKSEIVGLEMPPFDGGNKFLISEWRKEWNEERDEQDD